MKDYWLYHGDCLEVLPTLDAGSVDAFICDIPYGTTACKWDEIIPIDRMWQEVKRLSNVFITTASQPFTSRLVMSNKKNFSHELIWNKGAGMGHNAKVMPIKIHESCLIFSYGGMIYNPQMENKIHFRPPPKTYKTELMDLLQCKRDIKHLEGGKKYPVSILTISGRSKEINSLNRIHPTQKPVALYEYLIRTYTNPGDTVCDLAMGSGTTGVAAIQTGRKFIGIEIDKDYFEIAQKRIQNTQPPLFVEKQEIKSPEPKQSKLWEQA